MPKPGLQRSWHATLRVGICRARQHPEHGALLALVDQPARGQPVPGLAEPS